MKTVIISTFVLCGSFLLNTLSSSKFHTIYYINIISNNEGDSCVKNIDSLYDRKDILDTLATKMNYLAGYYNVNHPNGYKVIDENFYNFFVYDLVDTSNNSKNGCVQFLNNHVYHFSSLNIRFLYSNILVLNDGKLQFFLGINCKNRINSIEEVVKYLTSHLRNNSQKDLIIDRVKNYKKHGNYYRVDNFSSILCEE